MSSEGYANVDGWAGWRLRWRVDVPRPGGDRYGGEMVPRSRPGGDRYGGEKVPRSRPGGDRNGSEMVPRCRPGGVGDGD